MHSVAMLVYRAGRVMVEQNLQFGGRSSVVQKCSGKFLTLRTKLLKKEEGTLFVIALLKL